MKRVRGQKKLEVSKGGKGLKESSSPLQLTDTEESDGQGALQKIQESKEVNKRGPASDTQKHWHQPVKSIEPGKQLRWKFKCCYCDT